MRLGLDRLWLFLALALPALAALIVPLPAVDLAYQLRLGDQVLATGAIPTTDTFTFTAFGTPWTDQQWLAQVVLAVGYRLGGWELLAVARAALVATSLGFVAVAAMERGAAARTAAVLTLAAFVLATPALALRPQLLGIVLFAALLWLVAGRRRHPRRYLVAPLLIVVWANVHGSVVLAPLLLGYAWLEDVVEHVDWRPSLAVLVAGTLATLVTPFGIGLWGYAVSLGSDPEVTSRVAEWQRTTPFTVPGLLFYASAAAVAVLGWLRRDRVRWPELVWLCALFAIGAWTVRGLAWWPLGAAVVTAGWLPARDVGRHPRPNALNALTASVIALAMIAALPWWRPLDPLTGREGMLAYAPSDLAQALREQVASGDHVFVPQPWGSWFEWAVPDALYFVDSRIELFPMDVWRAYDEIASGGPGAVKVLDDHAIQFVATEPDDPVIERLRLAGGWVETIKVPEGVVMVRAP